MIKKDLKIYTVNPSYLIFGKVNGYFKEIKENNYLKLVRTNKSREKNLKNMRNYGVKSEI